MADLTRELTIVAFSGSLRAASYNTALLREAASLLPAGVTLTLESYRDLPLFDPDLGEVAAVEALKSKVRGADGVGIVSVAAFVACCSRFACVHCCVATGKNLSQPYILWGNDEYNDSTRPSNGGTWHRVPDTWAHCATPGSRNSHAVTSCRESGPRGSTWDSRRMCCRGRRLPRHSR